MIILDQALIPLRLTGPMALDTVCRNVGWEEQWARPRSRPARPITVGGQADVAVMVRSTDERPIAEGGEGHSTRPLLAADRDGFVERHGL